MATTIISNTDIQILTPSGYQTFSGISKTWHDRTITVNISDGTNIRGSLNHKIKTANNTFKFLKSIRPNEKIFTGQSVISIALNTEGEYLYDLLDVEGGNEYNTGSIVSHNCEFLSSDPLLISSLKMQTFKTSEPIREQGMFRFWKEPDPTKAFIVGCDVASGTGSDFSTITVLEFPSLFQVAELRTNTISLPQLYGRLKWIVNYLATPAERHRRAPDVFWSFENNGLGHALIALYQNDENPTMGELISTDNKQLGVNTNGKTKILACLKFKALVEKAKNGLVINSDLLLAEMKNYVQSGGSYAAKPGATDDLISSVLVCMQIIKKMSEFDEQAFSITHEYDEVNRGLDNDGNVIEEDLDSMEPFGIF